MFNYNLDHLKELESESICVLREVAAQFIHPVLLFSGGKDSIVVSHLARKAFHPAKVPFKLLHIDTEHNFPETIVFRDHFAKEYNYTLIVRSVQSSIDAGRVKEESGPNASRNRLQTVTLLDAIKEFGFDAAIGGARRDEEKARAKERFFSHRDEFGQWDPKNQRPELWNLFNAHKKSGEHFRIFPLSNWTELDVWSYIERENISLPSIYFSHERKVFRRNEQWYAHAEFMQLQKDEKVLLKRVRFRTVGDQTCTGAMESDASSVKEIIDELRTSNITERGSRIDDRFSDTAMEDRKKSGYF
ncbi:MAG: sulfate adenylyltransferase subunit CysD [Bacteroidetes bacterium]|nr:MAG: sulfate adenylyltransferase subunit CysD [Bacteroidota bacterium]REK04897.1 MAG: sulfate adenylyltransferase subunit CysD [Bacteroidota bacterium]REK36369.1 MAG: sulfate adenylyltransferase subunit CysD [Bacteroidota bacterium]REK50965.1 MAG: sulfate adenylyltransferase subunit CysD [Bacteroidota bacterium]